MDKTSKFVEPESASSDEHLSIPHEWFLDPQKIEGGEVWVSYRKILLTLAGRQILGLQYIVGTEEFKWVRRKNGLPEAFRGLSEFDRRFCNRRPNPS